MTSLLSGWTANPVLTRHLRTSFTGPRLALSFGLIGIWALICVGIGAEGAGRTTGSYGGAPLFAFQIMLLMALCVLVPIKVSGVLEGARINKVFDQIVVTGVAPQHLFAGAWVAGLLQAVLVCFATAPFAAALSVFFEVPVWSLIRVYFILLVYSNLIIGFTLAVSLLAREWITAPLAIGVLVALSIISFAPDRFLWRDYPALLAELSPARYLFKMALPEQLNRLPNMEPAFFFARFDWLWVWFVGWPLLLGGFVLFLWVGPGHGFRPGLNNFGAVVLPGDQNRGLLARLRGELTRKVELGFFYENAPAWVRRWGYPLRMGLVLALVVFCWGAILGLLTRQLPWVSMSTTALREDFAPSTIWIPLAPLGLFWALMLDAAPDTRLAHPWLRGTVTRERSIWLMSLLMLGMWVLMEFGCLAFRMLKPGANLGTPYLMSWLGLAGQALLFALNVFLLSRLASRAAQTVQAARVRFGLYLAALIGLPLMGVAFMHEHDLRSAVWTPVAAMFPGSLTMFQRLGFATGEGAFAAYAAGHLILSVLLIWRFRRAGRGQVKGAAALLIVALCTPELPAQGQRLEANAGTSLVRVQDLAWGFDGLVRSDSNHFFTLELQNTSSQQVTARVRVEANDSRALHHQRVDLAAGQRQIVRLRFDAPLNPGNRWRRRVPVLILEAEGETWRSKPFDGIEGGWVGSVNSGSSGQRHLFVGVNRGSAQNLLLGEKSLQDKIQAHGCRAASLGTRLQDYSGIVGVWLAAEALPQLQASQRLALLGYLRLGGQLFVWGELRAEHLEGVGELGELFAARSTDAQGRARFAQALPTEKAGVFDMDISRRRVGTGVLHMLRHPPLLPLVPERLRAPDGVDRAEARQFLDLLPGLNFPTRVTAPYRGVRGDESRLIYLLVFGGIYALGFPLLLLFFGRGKQRRRRMWWIVAGVPLLAVVPLPMLHWASQSWSSLGQVYQVDTFYPDSTEGLRDLHVRVASPGRMQQELRWQVPPGSIFWQENRGNFFRSRSVPSAGWAGGWQRLQLDLRPGRVDEFRGLARTRLEQPFKVEVSPVDQRNRKLRIHIPDQLDYHMVWFLGARSKNNQAKLVVPDARGWIEISIPRRTPRRLSNRWIRIGGESALDLDWPQNQRPPFLLIIERKRNAPAPVTAAGMEFERRMRYFYRRGTGPNSRDLTVTRDGVTERLLTRLVLVPIDPDSR